MDEGAPQLWPISDLEPEKEPEKLAAELAKHFSNITNEARSLVENDIPKSEVPNILIP